MDGKKNKKNKKKKGNNQNRITDDVPVSPEEIVVPHQDNGSASQQNNHPQPTGYMDVQSTGMSESDVEHIELEKHKIYENNSVNLLGQLEDEKNLRLQKEASMEERIKLLQDDIKLCVGNEASLEDRVKDLQNRSDSSLLKEATLENRVKYIEGIQDSWIKKESSINEMIARLDELNNGLQKEVKELKESRDKLSEENIQLKQSITAMESRIQYLETEASFSRSSTVKLTELPEGKDSKYQSEAVNKSAEQLQSENRVPIDTVEEAHSEINQLNISAEHSTDEHLASAAVPTDYTLNYNVATYEGSDEIIQSSPRAHDTFTIPNRDEDFGSVNGAHGGQLVGIDNSRISEDVVSVPLDDIQVLETEPKVAASKEDCELPLSDAPLIGAPFRFISFVAKYVSGADLVNQERSRSG